MQDLYQARLDLQRMVERLFCRRPITHQSIIASAEHRNLAVPRVELLSALITRDRFAPATLLAVSTHRESRKFRRYSARSFRQWRVLSKRMRDRLPAHKNKKPTPGELHPDAGDNRSASSASARAFNFCSESECAASVAYSPCCSKWTVAHARAQTWDQARSPARRAGRPQRCLRHL